MKILLTNTATLTTVADGFIVTFFLKKGDDKLTKLSFNGVTINTIDSRYDDFCIITFNDGNEHTLVVTDYEEPLLDGEMFI